MQQMDEVIRYKHLELEVPSGMTAEQALRFYSKNYPELEIAFLSTPFNDGSKRVFEVTSPKAGTKG